MPRIGIVAVLLIMGAGASGYTAGVFVEEGRRQPVEIANNCAYYDMDSGKFTWGAKPVVVKLETSGDMVFDAEAQAFPGAANPPHPKKKPKHQ